MCIKPTPRKYDKCVDKCTIIYTTKARGWSLITHPDQTPRTCVWWHILYHNVFILVLGYIQRKCYYLHLNSFILKKLSVFAILPPSTAPTKKNKIKKIYWNFILVLDYIQRTFNNFEKKKLNVFAILTKNILFFILKLYTLLLLLDFF